MVLHCTILKVESGEVAGIPFMAHMARMSGHSTFKASASSFTLNLTV